MRDQNKIFELNDDATREELDAMIEAIMTKKNISDKEKKSTNLTVSNIKVIAV